MTSLSLSEKAKGKQRVIEPLGSNTGASSSSQSAADTPDTQHLSRDLVVRFTEGFTDLTVAVEKQDTAKDVKRKVGVLLFSLAPSERCG